MKDAGVYGTLPHGVMSPLGLWRGWIGELAGRPLRPAVGPFSACGWVRTGARLRLREPRDHAPQSPRAGRDPDLCEFGGHVHGGADEVHSTRRNRPSRARSRRRARRLRRLADARSCSRRGAFGRAGRGGLRPRADGRGGLSGRGGAWGRGGALGRAGAWGCASAWGCARGGVAGHGDGAGRRRRSLHAPAVRPRPREPAQDLRGTLIAHSRQSSRTARPSVVPVVLRRPGSGSLSPACSGFSTTTRVPAGGLPFRGPTGTVTRVRVGRQVGKR
jgi:hypothetical protein